MKVLAIDTSSPSGSIAVLEDKKLIAELSTGEAGTHSAWLLNAVDGLLCGAGLTVKDIDLFAVASGPGSFTGLRIGVTAVKSLAWSLGKKTAGVSTLASLARNVPYSSMPVCPVLDARKGEVYTSIYDTREGRPGVVLPDSAMKPQELFRQIEEKTEGPVLFLGEGLRAYGDEIAANVKDAVFAPWQTWQIRASNIAMEALEKGVFTDPSLLAPVYLRKSEAELKLGR